MADPHPQAGLITSEVLRRIRADNRTLVRASDDVQVSIETGQYDQALPVATELREAIRRHVLLVDGVIDVLTPDDITRGGKAR